MSLLGRSHTDYEEMIEADAHARKSQQKQANHFLHQLPNVPYRALLMRYNKEKKDWDKSTKRAKSGNSLVKIMHAAMSYSEVPKIEMLESLLKFKQKIDAASPINLDRLITNYLSKDNTDVEELSRLDDYLPKYFKYKYDQEDYERLRGVCLHI